RLAESESAPNSAWKRRCTRTARQGQNPGCQRQAVGIGWRGRECLGSACGRQRTLHMPACGGAYAAGKCPACAASSAGLKKVSSHSGSNTSPGGECKGACACQRMPCYGWRVQCAVGTLS